VPPARILPDSHDEVTAAWHHAIPQHDSDGNISVCISASALLPSANQPFDNNSYCFVKVTRSVTFILKSV
jgi:hypothetical protein